MFPAGLIRQLGANDVDRPQELAFVLVDLDRVSDNISDSVDKKEYLPFCKT